MQATNTEPRPARTLSGLQWLSYLILGILFGITLTQAQVLSWFRIQEMFRFHSERMYLIIASAIVVAAVSLRLIKSLNARSITGAPITVPPKTLGGGVHYALGGVCFGIGWAFIGACPGPMFALMGHGMTVMAAAVLSAMIGTWFYGLLRPRLPH